MISPRFRDEFVIRRSSESGLRNFLEFRFRIDVEGGFENVVGFQKYVLGNERAHGFETQIEIERSKERFERICENVGVLIAAGEGLPTGKQYEFSKTDAFGRLGEVFPTDERRTDVGHFALGFLWKFRIEKFGGYEFKDGVS